MAKSGIEVEGLKKLIKSLESMGVEVSDLKAAFTRIGDRAAQLASSFAPSRTGRLKGSVKPVKSKNRAAVRTSLPYAGAINYGWQKHHIEPAHFMQKADDAIRPDLIPMLEEEIGTLLRGQGLQ